MKKYITYIGILVIGMLLGWLILSPLLKTDKVVQTESRSNSTAESVENVSLQKWTCAMHPQIIHAGPGKCPICGMDLIPLEISQHKHSKNQFKLTDDAMALANIQTTVVGKGTAEATRIKLSGKIEENGDEIKTQPAHFKIRMEQLYITSIGQKVNHGDLVAKVYSPQLVAAQEELLVSAKNKESQPELYQAVRQKFKNWMVDDAELDKIEKSGKVETQFPIHAHISGYVTEINATIGAHVLSGQPIFKVANLETVWAIFDVYENQIEYIKKGDELSITTRAYPNQELKAKVDYIYPFMDRQSRTVKLRAVLNNKNHELKPGMFAAAELQLPNLNKDSTLVIPASAVLWTGKRSVVYVKTDPEENGFEMREVELGKKIGENYQILSGLNNGVEIVTNGTFTVDATAQLQGKTSMMNSNDKETEGQKGKEALNSTENTKHSIVNERIVVSKKFQEQLKNVVENYITLKDGLVNDDSKKAKVAAAAVVSSLAKIDVKLVSDKKALKQWEKLESEIKVAANSIATETDIKTQRDHFLNLSSNLISAVEIFGINKNVYLQFCPMADDNKGAYWLSKDENVLNPYFGKAMHTCGNVTYMIE